MVHPIGAWSSQTSSRHPSHGWCVARALPCMCEKSGLLRVADAWSETIKVSRVPPSLPPRCFVLFGACLLPNHLSRQAGDNVVYVVGCAGEQPVCHLLLEFGEMRFLGVGAADFASQVKSA